MWVAFANAKATHIFFSKSNSLYAIFNDQSFKDTLTDNIVSFEQLGPDILCWKCNYVWKYKSYEFMTISGLKTSQPVRFIY